MKHTTRRAGAHIAGAIAGTATVMLALSGCSAPSSPTEPETSASAFTEPSTGSLPTSASTAGEVPPASAAPADDEPTPEPGVENDALALASSAVTAFCRPTLDYDTWIAELYPFLSQQAAVAYETVDPANVPCTTLTGPASVRDGDGAFTVRILVPTDAGEYSVYVHRTVETAPWAVEQITSLASE